MSGGFGFYRAELHLMEMRSSTDERGYVSEREVLRVADVTVTGANPAEVLSALERHVAELAEWHTNREREQEKETTDGR